MTSTTEAPAFFEEVGVRKIPSQIADTWVLDPVAAKYKPFVGGLYVSSHLLRYDGYELYQWFGKLAVGLYRPVGHIMRPTAAGYEQLAQETFK